MTFGKFFAVATQCDRGRIISPEPLQHDGQDNFTAAPA
jgi:hypothetical protein